MGRIAILVFVCSFLWSLGMTRADERSFPLYYTAEDSVVFERYVCSMEEEAGGDLEDLLIRTALFFRETPYVGGTLEQEPEGLVANLREMDCTTFVESALALARTLREESPSFSSFLDNLREIRYREGMIRGYTDRLHYMTDWVYENERKGIVRDVTRELGGSPWRLALSFISAHPDRYRQLDGHPELVRVMRDRERAINGRPHYYIPKEELARLEGGIRNGDIISFVTSIKGLDVTHTGIAYWREGELTFIHASSVAGKVIVQPSSLVEYMTGIKRCVGLLVARPITAH